MHTIKLDLLALKNGHKALDLGCGTGRHTHAFYYYRRCHAIGLDLGFEDICTARAGLEAAPDLEPQIGAPRMAGFVQGNALALPFTENTFDRLICSEVLEHIPDYRQAIAEMYRITKPGGRIGISVPRAWPERICWMLSTAYHNQPGGHVRIFNAKQLQRDFEAQGFICTHHHYAHGLHSPYWWLQCLFGVDKAPNWLIRLYHKLLVLEIMKNPLWLHPLSKCADWVMGKSTVFYFDKPREV